MSYWDSSALVKLYSKETDSSVFEQFAAKAQTTPTTARLAFYEIQTTLRRKEAEGTLTAGAAQRNHERLIQDAADGQIRILFMRFLKTVYFGRWEKSNCPNGRK
jgi:predicted nucleic acid-binding protein